MTQEVKMVPITEQLLSQTVSSQYEQRNRRLLYNVILGICAIPGGVPIIPALAFLGVPWHDAGMKREGLWNAAKYQAQVLRDQGVATPLVEGILQDPSTWKRRTFSRQTLDEARMVQTIANRNVLQSTGRR